jgi:hypothetical protein
MYNGGLIYGASPWPGNRFESVNEPDGAVEAGVEAVESLPSELGSSAASGEVPVTGTFVRDSGDSSSDPGMAEKSATPPSPK